MESIWDKALGEMPHVLAVGWNLTVAVLILIIGWWVSSLLGNTVHRAAEKSNHVDRTIIPMLRSASAWAVRIFTLIAVLARFGVQTTSLIAVLGAAGLAVGLALQGTLQNIAAGIMLLILRPIRTGEYVALSTGGISGTVDEIGLFLSRFINDDGIVIMLPNSTVWGATVTNYSRNATRRFEMPIIINYDDDLGEAMKLVGKVATEHRLVDQTPEPIVKASEYTERGTKIILRVWARSSSYWEMRWDLMHQIFAALQAAGFRPAAQTRDVREIGGGEAAPSHPSTGDVRWPFRYTPAAD